MEIAISRVVSIGSLCERKRSLSGRPATSSITSIKLFSYLSRA
jgi:hypothetical protein